MAGRLADPSLTNAPYFHGLLIRDEAKSILKKEGDFLVRTSEPAEPSKREHIISVHHNGEPRHFVIVMKDGKFSVDVGHEFASVTELVDHYVQNKTSITSVPPADTFLLKPIGNADWELDHDSIELKRKLGQGAFGEVHMGEMRTKSGKKVFVAVKLAKLANLTKEQIREFMREARIMRIIQHENIVKMYGVAVKQEPLMITMELANHGSLDTYLRRNKVTLENKMDMIRQAARGLAYVHMMNHIHRDVALRNILYHESTVKLSDFGLTRVGDKYKMVVNRKVPIRWLSPETLTTMLFTRKSDVFSFGILCWELLHNGAQPYPNMSVGEVATKVRDGYRMVFNDVPGLSREFDRLVSTRMWAGSPNLRATMGEVAGICDGICMKQSKLGPTENGTETETGTGTGTGTGTETDTGPDNHSPDQKLVPVAKAPKEAPARITPKMVADPKACKKPAVAKQQKPPTVRKPTSRERVKKPKGGAATSKGKPNPAAK